MARKLLVLLAVVLSVGFTAAAQDLKSQPPIIAQLDNKWYAVSPVDGSATVLVEPEGDEKLSALLEGNLSPDGQWLAYTTRLYDKVAKVSHYKLFLMNLTTREVQMINPSGGIFDRPAPANHVFQLFLPTWSYDGTRLYYVRNETEVSERSVIVAGQLAYYELAAGTHHLAARLDPAKVVDELSAVPDGMILRTVKAGSDLLNLTFYAPNNAIIKASLLANVSPTPVVFKGDIYFVDVVDNTIGTLFNAATGETVKIDEGYFPAFRSQAAGDGSLRFFHMFNNGSNWKVYGSDHTTLLQTVRPKMGARLAVSPDGQAAAYILYTKPGEGSIQVIDPDGTNRDLQFNAELIVWGALEGEAFLVNE